MLIFTSGNIFEAQADAHVNPVNCMGVMGKGLALEFKERFPQNYTAYKFDCQRKNVRVGEMHVCFIHEHGYPKYIINFPTKIHWKDRSQLSYIHAGLHALLRCIEELKLSSVALPRIGCGLGGLDWVFVKKEIQKILGNVPNVNIFVYEDVSK